MRKVVGKRTLAWAQGPGRQSGALALSAAAIALLPGLALVVPDCSSLASCTKHWSQVLLVPRLLAMPAAVVALVLLGSWWAQVRHAAFDRLHFAQKDLRSDLDVPPGVVDRSDIENDLARRTLLYASRGALVGGLGMAGFLFTSVATRRCNVVNSDNGLQICTTAASWTDTLLAYEVWLVVAGSLLMALIWYTRSTSIRVVAKVPKKRFWRKRSNQA